MWLSNIFTWCAACLSILTRSFIEQSLLIFMRSNLSVLGFFNGLCFWFDTKPNTSFLCPRAQRFSSVVVLESWRVTWLKKCRVAVQNWGPTWDSRVGAGRGTFYSLEVVILWGQSSVPGWLELHRSSRWSSCNMTRGSSFPSPRILIDPQRIVYPCLQKTLLRPREGLDLNTNLMLPRVMTILLCQLTWISTISIAWDVWVSKDSHQPTGVPKTLQKVFKVRVISLIILRQ